MDASISLACADTMPKGFLFENWYDDGALPLDFASLADLNDILVGE